MQLIERGQIHEFRSEGGCIIEEISTTHVAEGLALHGRPDRGQRPHGAQDRRGGVVNTLDRLRRAVRGTAQWVGRRPITEPALPRLALSSWTETVLRAERSPFAATCS